MIDLHHAERGAELLLKTRCSLEEGPRQIVVASILVAIKVS